MALVPHKITALAESDAQGTDGKNIVAGAVVSLYDTNGTVVTLFDDANGTNGSTTKQTDATGQVVVYVTPGEYDEEVNGSVKRRVSIGGNGLTSYPTTASLESSRPTKTGQRAENRERANAQYTLAAEGYTALAGDVVAANGRVWELQDLENFRAYGDVNDSVDCGPLIQTVLNSGRSSIYKFRGSFTVDTPAVANGIGNLTLDCNGAYFDCSNMYGNDAVNRPDPLFGFFGSEYGTTTVISDISQGDTSITVADGTSVKEGDVIFFESSGEVWQGSTVRKNVNYAKNVTGNVVTLANPVPFSFDATSYTVNLESYDCVENIEVFGGIFYGGNYRRATTNSTGIGFVFGEYVRNVRIHDLTIDGFENAAIRLQKGDLFNTKNLDIQGFAENYTGVESSGFYGVFCSKYITWQMDGVTGRRLRHMQDCSEAMNTYISNCDAYNCYIEPYGSHSGVYYGKYVNINCNTEKSCLAWRGFNLDVIDSELNSYGTGTNGINDVASSTGDLPATYNIINSKIYADRSALTFSGSVKECNIKQGRYEGGVTGNYAAIDVSSDTIGDLVIDSAKIFTTSATNAVQSMNGSPTQKDLIKLVNCEISGYIGNAVRITVPSSIGTVFWCKNNLLDGNPGSGHITEGVADDFDHIFDNYLRDGTLVS